MKLFDRESTLSDHPIISAVINAAATTRDGLVSSLMGGGDEEPSLPGASGPVNGPAPTEETVRSPIVSFDVEAEDTTHQATVQFWTPADGGAILGAWQINGQDGKGAILDKEGSRLLLGEKPYWTADGEQYPTVDLSDAVLDGLWEAFTSLMAHHRSHRFGIVGEDVGQDTFEETPAPSTDTQGALVTGQVTNGTSVLNAQFQPWRPESKSTVYVAWQIGDQAGRYGILHASGLWIGRQDQFVAPNGVITPFLHIEDIQFRDELEESVSDVRLDVSAEDQMRSGTRVDVEYSDHPEAPGHTNPWGDRSIDQADEEENLS